MYAILNGQSNHSLTSCDFFKLVAIGGDYSPYLMRICAGTTEMSRRKAVGFQIEAMNSELCLDLPHSFFSLIVNLTYGNQHTYISDHSSSWPQLAMKMKTLSWNTPVARSSCRCFLTASMSCGWIGRALYLNGVSSESLMWCLTLSVLPKSRSVWVKTSGILLSLWVKRDRRVCKVKCHTRGLRWIHSLMTHSHFACEIGQFVLHRDQQSLLTGMVMPCSDSV